MGGQYTCQITIPTSSMRGNSLLGNIGHIVMVGVVVVLLEQGPALIHALRQLVHLDCGG